APPSPSSRRSPCPPVVVSSSSSTMAVQRTLHLKSPPLCQSSRLSTVHSAFLQTFCPCDGRASAADCIECRLGELLLLLPLPSRPPQPLCRTRRCCCLSQTGTVGGSSQEDETGSL